jgi:hypothetical protein
MLSKYCAVIGQFSPVCCAISKYFFWYSIASSYRLIECRASTMLLYAVPSLLLLPNGQNKLQLDFRNTAL